MKIYFMRKRIFGLLFLLGLGAFSVANILHSLPVIQEDLEDGEIQTVADLEKSIDYSLYKKMDLIETFGYLNKLMDKREIKNFTCIQDEEGYLHYASFFQEPNQKLFDYALRIKQIQDTAAAKGAKTLFVTPPAKYCMDHRLRPGMPLADQSDSVEELLMWLNRLGVNTLNLQNDMPGDHISYDDLFYRTDHHWTIPGTFLAAGLITEELEKMGAAPMDPEHIYTNPDSYHAVTYQNVMLGSLGRKTGANYSGLEDFTCLWPLFQGSYSRKWVNLGSQEGEEEGSFTEALMNTSYLQKHNIYSRESLYGMYLKELNVYEHIVNRENPDGPKILMIRDSYMSPVIAFMAPMCSQIEAVWCGNNHSDYQVEDIVENHDYDYVIVEIYPFNINDESMNFYKG